MIRTAVHRIGAVALRKLEIESKFTPTKKSLRLLRHNAGQPTFDTLRPLKTTSFRDEYYDFRGTLQRQNIWIRKRDGIWEAKCRRVGNFVDSAFEEVEGEAKVSQVAQEAGMLLGLDHLTCTATFRTTRLELLANSRFCIAIDVTDFGHRIGEVELTKEISMTEGGLGTDGSIASLQDELKCFMAKYRWAFPDDGKKPIGKLSAFHALPEPTKALVQ